IRDFHVTGVQTCALPISTVIGLDVSRSLSSVLQARRLRPLMRIASEPQTPWAQDRRKDSEPSISHLILWRASSTRSVPYIVTLRSEERRVGKEGRARWAA